MDGDANAWRLLMTDATGAGAAFPDDIDQHPAGPELDVVLAERVLGARVGRYRETWSGYENWVATTPEGAELFIMVSPHSAYGAVPLWNPSTDLADAQGLAQHLRMDVDYRTMTDEATGEKRYSVTLPAQRPVQNAAPGAEARPGDAPQQGETHSVTG